MQQDFEQARQYYLAGMLIDSLNICEALLSQNPDHADALNLIGMLCYRGGDALTAIGYFEKAVQVAPDHAEALGNLALCLKGSGRLLEAFEVYEKAIALDPTDPQVHYNYGLALRLGRKLEQAAIHLTRAAEIAPLLGDVFNLLGIVRSELGQTDLAILAFRNALGAHPESTAPYLNLSSCLTDTNQLDEAIKILTLGTTVHGLPMMGRQLAATQELAGQLAAAAATLAAFTAIKPDDLEALETLGDLRFKLGWFDEALQAFRQVVAKDPSRARAHMQIYSIAQILGRPALALQHQAMALAQTRLFSETGKNTLGPSLLILKAPGDWQINTPTDFILNTDDWGVVHHYYLDENRPIDPLIPECDIIFNAIAEPDRAAGALKAAAKIVAFLDKPCINDPSAMAQATRDQAALTLKGLTQAVIPKVKKITTLAELESLAYPYLLRPAGTHAGNGMILVEHASDLPAQLDGPFYAVPFIDYVSADGQYRKYRVVVVGGVAYPFHLGVSVNWMVHYANAKPKNQNQMNEEEESFLKDIQTIFTPAHLADFATMASLLKLDFFAVDCGISQAGQMVLFEVDAGAIIHTLDNPALFAYKHTYVPHIFEALRTLILAKIKACQTD